MNSKLIVNLECYNRIFIFENNLREFIRIELEKHFGTSWFSRLDADIQSIANSQKGQLINYLSPDKINQNILSFLFLSHLREIILNNWPNLFFPFFSNADRQINRCKGKISDKLFEIEVIRNLLSHAHLLDEPLLIQLNANINFFKKYISNYDENIFLGVDISHSDELGIKLDEIINLIELKMVVPKVLLGQLKKNEPEVYALVEKYNKIPKTRDKREKLNSFLKESYLLKKLTLMRGYN